MKYPITVDISLIQEDFIEVEMIENIIDSIDLKKETIKVFCLQAIGCFLVSAVLYFQSWAAKQSLFLVLFFFLMFLINFAYRYFYGIKHELNMNLKHLILSNQNGNSFFAPEDGIVNFYEDRCEYLTNENRRYFKNDNINYIKNTKRLYIFVMKYSKEKGLKGFIYMIIPKRCIDEEKKALLDEHCENIIQKHNILNWVEDTIFD